MRVIPKVLKLLPREKDETANSAEFTDVELSIRSAYFDALRLLMPNCRNWIKLDHFFSSPMVFPSRDS